MAVFSAGQGVELDMTDLGLKKALPVHDFGGYIAYYAARNPDITFVHVYPGLVITPHLKRHAKALSFTCEFLATCRSTKVCSKHQL
ncbi:hypothetical protein C8R45DRAFT_1101368 [Mycena sanguinolenta]|nr:hypothetical protein C8R45DRAFT_1101368 [Mycena sanguinolenta]